MAEIEREAGAVEGAQEGKPEAAAETEDRSTEQHVNLDEFEDFRKFKSMTDKRIAEERSRREQVEQQLGQLQQQLEEAALKDAPPEEQVTYLKGKMARLQQERARDQYVQQQRQKVNQEAIRLLSDLGIRQDHPELDWSGDPLQDGMARLAASAARIAAGQAKVSKKTVEAKVREAKQEAVKETGAADVSTATEGAGPSLQAQYQKDLAELRGSRDYRAYVELKRRYREKGLPV